MDNGMRNGMDNGMDNGTDIAADPDDFTVDELGWPAAGPNAAEPNSAGAPPERRPPPSRVFSIRLGHDEVADLQERASGLHVEPSVLARAFIRRGLLRLPSDAVERAVFDVEAAVIGLRRALL